MLSEIQPFSLFTDQIIINNDPDINNNDPEEIFPDEFPEDMVSEIFKHIESVYVLGSLLLVSKKWNVLCQKEWKPFFEKWPLLKQCSVFELKEAQSNYIRSFAFIGDPIKIIAKTKPWLAEIPRDWLFKTLETIRVIPTVGKIRDDDRMTKIYKEALYKFEKIVSKNINSNICYVRVELFPPETYDPVYFRHPDIDYSYSGHGHHSGIFDFSGPSYLPCEQVKIAIEANKPLTVEIHSKLKIEISFPEKSLDSLNKVIENGSCTGNVPSYKCFAFPHQIQQ